MFKVGQDVYVHYAKEGALILYLAKALMVSDEYTKSIVKKIYISRYIKSIRVDSELNIHVDSIRGNAENTFSLAARKLFKKIFSKEFGEGY